MKHNTVDEKRIIKKVTIQKYLTNMTYKHKVI